MFKPMLANNYIDHSHRLQWPVATQPKLNGVRMIWSQGQVFSRSGKPLQLPDLLTEQLRLLKHVDLDGELYAHGYHLDRIRGNAKRIVSLVQDLDLQFHVYDVYRPNAIETPFKERMELLHEVPESSHIKIISTTLAEDDDTVRNLMQDHLNKGYEGIMIRDLHAAYINRRTNALLKLKPWHYTTAVIIGFVEGKGKYVGILGAIRVKRSQNTAGGPGWICNVGGGFNDEQRAKIWENQDRLNGVRIMMKYLELTSLDNPHSPIFIEFYGKDKGILGE